MPEDLTIGIIPSDNPVFTPEENLRLAASEAVNNTLVINPLPPTEQVVTGRGWAFDFSTGSFRRQGASPARVSGDDQIKAWIEKTIYTARFTHPVYSDQYGTEGLNDLIGRNDPATKPLISSAIRDALLVHDQISEVGDFRFDESGEALFVEFSVTLTNSATLSVPFALTGAA